MPYKKACGRVRKGRKEDDQRSGVVLIGGMAKQ